MKTETKEGIIICDLCKGKGKLDIRVSAYNSEVSTCHICNGQGRLVKVVTTEYKILK